MTLRISSNIERRLLVNFRVDPQVVAELLPEPLRPKVVGSSAVVGICFLRLRQIRPTGFPGIGLSSENVAHRIAVEWNGNDGMTAGVYVPRRDTSSRLAALVSGRLLEGELSFARFEVSDRESHLSIRIAGQDGLGIEIVARPTDVLDSELFSSLSEASRFFCEAPVAFSPSERRGVVEGVALDSPSWTATPMAVDHVQSSVLDDAALFPPGSWQFDSAMIIRKVPAHWCSAGVLPPVPDMAQTNRQRGTT